MEDSTGYAADFGRGGPRGPVSEVPHPNRAASGGPPSRLLLRLLCCARSSIQSRVLVHRLAHELAAPLESSLLPALHVRFNPRRGPPLRPQEVHVRFPDKVPVPERPFNVVRDLLRRGRPILRDVRANLPGPTFQLL